MAVQAIKQSCNVCVALSDKSNVAHPRSLPCLYFCAVFAFIRFTFAKKCRYIKNTNKGDYRCGEKSVPWMMMTAAAAAAAENQKWIVKNRKTSSNQLKMAQSNLKTCLLMNGSHVEALF